jgi:hypothetical protein
MKKFLIVGSMMLLWSINEVQASFMKKRESKNSRLSGFVYKNSRSNRPGEGKNILNALGVEWSRLDGYYVKKKTGAVSQYISFDKYNYFGDEIPGVFSDDESFESKNNKQNKMMKSIEAAYIQMTKPKGDIALMVEYLQQDIQDLESQVSKHSKQAKKQLEEFISLAQEVCNNFNEELIAEFAQGQQQLYMNLLKKQPVAEVITIAGVDLAKSKKENDPVGQAVYPELISWLQSIEKELEHFERKEKDFDEAIKLAEKAKRKAGLDVDQVNIYDAVIAQLEVDKTAVKEDSQKQKDESTAILKDFKFTDDPRKDLETAKADLNELEMDKISRMNYGYKENSKEVLEYDKKIKAQLKIIDEIKIRIKKFDNDVDRKIAETVKSHGGDKNKALESLLPKVSNTTYAYSFLDNASVQKKRIESITSDSENKNMSSKDKFIKQQAAKKLQEQIAADTLKAAEEDPLAMAKLRLSKASVTEIPGATQAVVFALLAKGGISIEKLPGDVQENLQITLMTASDKLIAIKQSIKLSESQKLQQQQIVTKKLIKDVGLIFSKARIGLGAGGIKAFSQGDLLGAGVDYITNQLINSAAE